ncbi:MAG TPA: FxLYD domain-containing protein [Bryobacteraceae bacterium]|nr:FxLYD domain-containing protein [Bryobacteraceae bacterium]
MGSKSLLVTLAIALVLAGGLLWYVNRPRPAAGPPALTPEAKAYVHNLHLSDVAMKATESYVKQTVTEIQGKITNTGDRTVNRADVFCIFYNVYGEVVLRERVQIVQSALKPGETRAFRLPFDDIPDGWNNQMPQLVIARIEFV